MRLSLGIFAVLLTFACCSAEIKVIHSTATSITWDFASVILPGKKYFVEVLFIASTGNVRVIDEPLSPRSKTFRARNLKSNKQYQFKIFPHGRGGKEEAILSSPTFTNLRCYSCIRAASVEDCTKIAECSPNQRQCFTQVRYYNRNGRSRFALSKGCKTSSDVCVPNQDRINLINRASSETGDLTIEQVLQTMPGLQFFDDVESLLERNPAILKKVKSKFDENKKLDYENALKDRCSRREDEDDFCRCCCSVERCNHATLDCGRTPPPPDEYKEPLPPDIATPPPETTYPVLPARKIPPPCRDYNGGCDHICIALNITTVHCECYKDYKLQDDGKTCKTHLLHAVADAGPDITISLPQTSVKLSASNTKGAVKSYKWWDPVAIGNGARVTITDSTKPELYVSNLSAGEYKFILMVTGMDGRRTSDVMTLTVLPDPATVNATEAPKKRRKPRIGVMSFNRFRSNSHRDEWKDYVKDNGIPTPSTSTGPRLLFTTRPSRSFQVIKGVKGTRTTTTTATTATTKATPSENKRGGHNVTRGKGKKLSGKVKGGKKPKVLKPKSMKGKGPAKLRSLNQGVEEPKRRPTSEVMDPKETAPTPEKNSRPATAKNRKPGTRKRPLPKPGKATAQSKTKTAASITTQKPEACSSLDVLQNREVLETCTDFNFKGSKCEFQCKGTRELRGGAASVVCGTFGGEPQWMKGPSPAVLPCCEQGCPANAFADVVFLIHSTTKTGKADWSRILNFVYGMIAEFTFGEDNLCVGAVRYHRAVDITSEVALDCTRTKADFRNSLSKMPFTGIGANTATGLNHLRTKSFKNPSNRETAQDVAVIITDSRSTGNVAKASKTLKATGVKVHVIGIKTKGGSPNLAQLKSMASFPARVRSLTKIPSAISPALKTQIQSLLCVSGCDRYDAEEVNVPVARPKALLS